MLQCYAVQRIAAMQLPSYTVRYVQSVSSRGRYPGVTAELITIWVMQRPEPPSAHEVVTLIRRSLCN
jgi:hypothetical protein